MKIEEEIFYRYQPIKEKLIPYGFILKNNVYFKEYPVFDGDFRLQIEIKEGQVSAKLYDVNTNDEYTLYRNEQMVGEYVGKIRDLVRYELIKLRNDCFKEVQFHDTQAQRIADYIFKKYADQLEFLWDKYPNFGVFRNKKNNHWYAIMMDVNDNQLAKNVSARSVINIKPSQDKYNELIQIKNIFPGWHMNKKIWITISLGNYFDDDFIESLIDMSYQEIELDNKKSSTRKNK